jgi:hypothetical protein
MTEVVRPLDGEPVALRPCPAWCAEGRHFAPDEVIYADHGYHHYGAESEVPTSYPFLGMTGGLPTIVRTVLKSWTHPLGADPGPARIEINLGTAAERTDMSAEIAPDEAEALARALLELAATARREEPAASDAASAGGR